MSADLSHRLLAEFVGTALLVIFGAGALAAALVMGHDKLDYPGLGIVAISEPQSTTGKVEGRRVLPENEQAEQ
ncbi:MAG: hypothetical protein ACRDPA_35440 [Solirubrobacteraceae bacterium]